jgi:hypothetical protein
VSNAAKLIAGMRRNPRDRRIEDLRVVADRVEKSPPDVAHALACSGELQLAVQIVG